MHNNIYLISLTVKRESERTLISRSSISLFIVSGTPMRLLIRFLSIISEFPLFVYCLFSFIYAFGLLTHCYLFRKYITQDIDFFCRCLSVSFVSQFSVMFFFFRVPFFFDLKFIFHFSLQTSRLFSKTIDLLFRGIFNPSN